MSIHDPSAEVDIDGNIKVYRRTSAQAAEQIRKTGVMTAQEDALFFSSKQNGYADDYGDAVLALSVPSTVLEVNDIFDGEVHFDIPLKRVNNRWALNVSSYLIDETKNTAENSGVKRQISIDRNGKYVEVDTEQHFFDGKTTEEMQSIARNVIKERFKGKVLPVNSSSSVYVDKRSADEYAYPANRRMDTVTKESKMRASVELDNLLAVSDFVRHENDDGRHKEVTGGWDVYSTRFSVAGNMFVGEVKIKNTAHGRVFYDVTQIKRLPVNGGQATNVAAASGNLSADSIANKKSAVNSNLSDSGEKITKFQKKLPDVQEKLRKMSGSDDIDAVKSMAYGIAEDFMQYAKSARLEMTETDGLMPQSTRVAEIVSKYNDYKRTGISNGQLRNDITDIFTDYMNGVSSSDTLYNYITDVIMKRELNSYEVIGDETFKTVRAYADGGRFSVSEETVRSLTDTFGSLGGKKRVYAVSLLFCVTAALRQDSICGDELSHVSSYFYAV